MLKEMTTSKNVTWHGPEQLHLETNRIAEIVPGSMLVKVHACAICGSDLRIYRDGNPRITPPQTIGHEISGEVVVIGDGVDRFQVGDRVSVGADIPCGECVHCTAGRSNCCDTNFAIGYQFAGGFAEYILLNPLVVKHGPVQRFNQHLSYELAALAEPLACCINGYERGLIQPRASVVIFGAGPIGIMLALLAPIYQASQIIMIDPSESRLVRANKLGVTQVINPKETDPVQEVLRLTHGLGADMIFTACPAVETHEQAIAMVAKRGVVNLFGGLPKNSASIQISSNFIHYREAYITGSHGSTPAQHKRALEYIESGKINLTNLITHRFSIDNFNEAFRTALSGEALKVVINPHA